MRWIHVCALLLTAAGLSGRAMSIVYEAKVRHARWLIGARVVVDLRLKNDGTGVFETPDPRYRTSPEPHFELTGPDRKKQAFQPNARATDADEGRAPTMLKVAPGKEWKSDLVLSQFADLSAPGRYVLHSWINAPGGRIDSPASEFEIVQPGTRDLAAELSIGEDNSRFVACVELMDGGHVASSILTERDPSNAELHAFERQDRGEGDPESSAILAPYSNYSVGLSAFRYIITESHHKVIVSHNLRPARVTAFRGEVVSSVLQPVATQGALYLAATRENEVLVNRFAATDGTLDAGPVWTVEKLSRPPVAAAMTVSPAASGSTLLIMVAWPAGTSTQVRLLTVSPQGKLIARADHTIPDGVPMPYAAAGWPSATLLVQKGNEARAVEVKLDGTVRSSNTVANVTDARIEYFDGRRGIVVRGGGKVMRIGDDGGVAPVHAAVPTTGPFTILPGRTHWYAVWPDKGKLAIAAI